MYIYVLLCQNDKYYVGKTIKDVQQRFNEHLLSFDNKCIFTLKNKPIKIIETLLTDDPLDEDKITKKYMMKYGIDNVRGGSYTKLILEDWQIKTLYHEFDSARDICYKCKKDDHFVNECNVICNNENDGDSENDSDNESDSENDGDSKNDSDNDGESENELIINDYDKNEYIVKNNEKNNKDSEYIDNFKTIDDINQELNILKIKLYDTSQIMEFIENTKNINLEMIDKIKDYFMNIDKITELEDEITELKDEYNRNKLNKNKEYLIKLKEKEEYLIKLKENEESINKLKIKIDDCEANIQRKIIQLHYQYFRDIDTLHNNNYIDGIKYEKSSIKYRPKLMNHIGWMNWKAPLLDKDTCFIMIYEIINLRLDKELLLKVIQDNYGNDKIIKNKLYKLYNKKINLITK